MARKKFNQKADEPQVADRLRAEGTWKSFSTRQFLGLAKEACEKSIAGNNQPMVAIILSAIAVETFLNEFVELTQKEFQESEREKLEALQSIMSELEKQRSSTPTKLQVAHFVLTGKPINKGELPYQDFDLLTTLRNLLVHSKVEKFKVALGEEKEYEPHSLVKRLIDRKVIEPPPKTAAPRWRSYVNKPEVAEWAYEVALEIIRFLIDLFPEGHTKEELGFMSSGHPSGKISEVNNS